MKFFITLLTLLTLFSMLALIQISKRNMNLQKENEEQYSKLYDQDLKGHILREKLARIRIEISKCNKNKSLCSQEMKNIADILDASANSEGSLLIPPMGGK
jgi:type II secretory pathway component PulL